GPAGLVLPDLLGVVAALEVDRLRAPVLLLAADVVAPLEDEDPLAGGSQRIGQGSTARPAADDDDVVMRVCGHDTPTLILGRGYAKCTKRPDGRNRRRHGAYVAHGRRNRFGTDARRRHDPLARGADGGPRSRPVHGLRRSLRDLARVTWVAADAGHRRRLRSTPAHGCSDGSDGDGAGVLALGPALRRAH